MLLGWLQDSDASCGLSPPTQMPLGALPWAGVSPLQKDPKVGVIWHSRHAS